ncbi:MAG: hypothetical protein QOG43_2815, partial [Actinomycetota bacterium]|nr:hypothetical protein [Actinomycetota bacterium]
MSYDATETVDESSEARGVLLDEVQRLRQTVEGLRQTLTDNNL